MSILSNPILIAGLAVILGIAVLGAASDTGSIGRVPAEESFTESKIKGIIQFAGGRSGAGTDYVGSWSSDGESSTIILNAQWSDLSGLTACYYTPESTRIVLSVDDRVVLTREYPGSENYRGRSLPTILPAVNYSFKGPVDGDHVLKAELQAKIRTEHGGCWGEQDWKVIARDGARLLDGAGTIALRDGTNLYQEGDTVRVGVATGNGGPWKVELFDGLGKIACGVKLEPASILAGALPGTPGYADTAADGTTGCVAPARYVIPGKFDGTLKFKIPTGAFRADGKNEWKLSLWNEVWKTGENRFFAIDKADLAPEVPVVKGPTNDVDQNSPFTLTMSSRANPRTHNPVREFQVTAWYGSSENFPSNPDDVIVRSKSVPALNASGAFTGTIDLVATKAANVRYSVVAIDSAGRPSGSYINGAQVRALQDGGLDKPNPSGEGTITITGASATSGLTPPSHPVDWGTIAVLLVGVLVAAAAAWYYIPLAPQVRTGAALAVVITGAAWIWSVAS